MTFTFSDTAQQYHQALSLIDVDGKDNREERKHRRLSKPFYYSSKYNKREIYE